MKKFTFTLALFILTTVVLFAQRGGTVYHDHNHYNNNSNTGQQRFSSMATLNDGKNGGGLRPNTNHHGHNGGHGHGHNGGHGHGHNGGHGHGHNGGHGHGHNGGHGHGHNGGHGHTNVVICSHGQNCSHGCSNRYYAHPPVHMDAFHSWVHSLSCERNSAVRMGIALDYVEHNWLTTHQIHDILALFTNQSTMLMIAERAYPNTCDPQNYHQLYSCFSNSACVLQLQQFVVNY